MGVCCGLLQLGRAVSVAFTAKKKFRCPADCFTCSKLADSVQELELPASLDIFKRAWQLVCRCLYEELKPEAVDVAFSCGKQCFAHWTRSLCYRLSGCCPMVCST